MSPISALSKKLHTTVAPHGHAQQRHAGGSHGHMGGSHAHAGGSQRTHATSQRTHAGTSHRTHGHAGSSPARSHAGTSAHRTHTTGATRHGHSTRDTFESSGRGPSVGAGGTTGAGRLEPMGAAERSRFEAMWPSIQRYARQYGVSPENVAGLIRQESHFQNFRVHADGTGHGIAGLDDGGRRCEFERWSGEYIGSGRNANVASVDRQIEFVARTLGSTTRRYGSENAALREWHRGAGGMNDSRGYQYQSLIARRRQEIFGR